VLDMAKERDVAVQTIKSITRRPYPSEQRTHSTWYEPLTDPDSITKAVHWVLGQPGIFLNTVGDIHLLPTVLEAAANLAPRPSDAEMDAVVSQWTMAPLFT
ncbi:MAG: aldo/keto reductase, partial [Anaerolineae bacterium]|nr:aldo/keto reductase [Anaerolineae bacterium]